MPMSENQRVALITWRELDKNYTETAKALSISRSALRDRIDRALKWEQASEGLTEAVEATGLDIAEVRHGWSIVEDEDTGRKFSVFFKSQQSTGQKVESLSEVIQEALADITPLAPIKSPPPMPQDLCNFIPLCDLHVGGEYGDPEYFNVCISSLENLISRLPHAKKAVLLDMGDLLDANDHKGLTPASFNECDVIRENHLKNTMDAINIMRFAINRLAETHEEVEVHLLRGNHDETAYIAVMVALEAYYKDNSRINIVVTQDEFRVIPWGKCGVFPHHGDKAKWEDLKSVFSDQFPEAWTSAKYWRYIWTAHVHHDKGRQLIGAVAEHFRTLASPNKWAMMKGLFSRGGLVAVTLHKEDGEISRTVENLKPLLLEDSPKTFGPK